MHRIGRMGAAHHVQLSVSDTGIGMPQSVLERAFEPFFTGTADGAGTGLGLSQVFGFVRQSSGQIYISSEVGRGTTIDIHLPAMPPAGAQFDAAELRGSVRHDVRGYGAERAVWDNPQKRRPVVSPDITMAI